MASHSGETLTCTGTMACPNGSSGRKEYTSSSPCQFTRKLCVTCSEKDGDVYIRVQGNSMPNHCSDATVNTAVDIEADWEVKFNPDVTGVLNYQESDINSVEKTSEILCDINRTSSANMLAVSDYTLTTFEGGSSQQSGGGPPPGGRLLQPSGNKPPPSGSGGLSGSGPPPSGGGSSGGQSSSDQMGT
jgi:hypothetical protein